jgi:hypothetical protein
MLKFRSRVFILLFLLLASPLRPAHAQASIQVIRNEASLAFPESLTFTAEFRSGAVINSVVLEYGVDQLACGTVEARAFPDFSPSSDLKVEWTWEMRQSGSLAPGTTVWWRWQLGDASGAQFTTPTQSILWLDDIHPWQVISGGNINLHYYNGGDSFGRQLYETAVGAHNRLSQDVGISTDEPVEIYIFASTTDLQEAVLYEPSWAGGQAFPQNNVIIIGISPDELEWGKSTMAHEMSHVLVGHLVFTCLGFVPTWLNEGLAVYSEGGPQVYMQGLFDQAVAGDTLMSLRSLGGNFPDTDAGYLAYAESYSVVNFLIKTYGRDKMTALFLKLRDGATDDEALAAVYGFNVDGLEDAWRTSIGLAPLGGESEPTPVPTPTVVPTFVPIDSAPLAQSNIPTPHPGVIKTPAAGTGGIQPDATPLPSGQEPGLDLPELATVLKIGLACLVITLLLAGLAIFLIVRHQKRSSK